RVQHLVEVAQRQRAPADLDVNAGAHALLRARDRVARAGASVSSVSSAAWSLAAGCRLRASLAAFTLASSAAMRSTTFGADAAGFGASNSSPAALRSMRSSTCSRYVSWKRSGWNSAASDATSDSAIATSLSLTSI